MKIAVFISGSGTNLQALLDAEREGFFQSEIALVVSNRRDAYGLVRAQEAGKATFVEGDGDLLEVLEENHIDFIVLAGYLKILGKELLTRYAGRMINIHPALLPSFRGLHAQRQAVEAGVKIAGCTVHFVVPDMDAGPIILQSAVPVYEDDTEDTLAARILTKEHPTYVRAAALFCDDKLTIDGNVVKGTQE